MKHRISSGERHPLRALYNEAGLPQDIRRSLNFILFGNLCGNLWGIICGGGTTAMVGLATSLGADDFTFAVLNAIPQIAALTQIPFSMRVNRTHKRKKYLLTYGIFSRALWLLFGLIPIIVPEGRYNYRLWTLIFLLGISSFYSSMINVCWFPWLSDIAPAEIRSRWLSVRDMILNVTNIAAGFGIAWLLDNLPPQTRYVIIFMLGGSVGILDMLCFAFCKEVYTTPPKKLGYREMFGDIFSNKPFMRFMLFWTAWCFTANMSGTYMSPYSMNVMGLTFTQIMVFATVASCVGAILTVRLWGSAAYGYGSANVMFMACIGASLTPLFYLFSSPGNVWPTLLHNLIGAMFWCGSNLACNAIQLSASREETRPSYIAVFSCVTALMGTALGSLSAGALLKFFSRNGMFTGTFDRYKVLFVIATVLRLGCVLLLVPGMENDRPATIRDMLRAIRRFPGR